MTSNPDSYFVAGLRTPFALAGKGAYKDIRPDDLLLHLADQHHSRFPTLWQSGVDDVIVGCAYPEGEQGYNIGRLLALGAGLNSPGMTVNRLCGSSLEALAIAHSFVQSGRGHSYLVAGTESMSRIPRRGANFNASSQFSAKAPEAYITMGETAEQVARLYPEISRAQQEVYAARSHEKAHQAFQGHFLQEQVINHLMSRDESIRVPIDLQKMAALKPAFAENGIVTAATSSPLSDGATLGFVVSGEMMAKLSLESALLIRDVCVAHVEPGVMGLGPVPAVKKLLQRNQVAISDISLFEINEAFAIQVLTCQKLLEIDAKQLNVWGGALANGHPLGASGLRIAMNLHGQLKELGKNGALGVGALCIGGGQGIAALFEFRSLRNMQAA